MDPGGHPGLPSRARQRAVHPDYAADQAGFSATLPQPGHLPPDCTAFDVQAAQNCIPHALHARTNVPRFAHSPHGPLLIEDLVVARTRRRWPPAPCSCKGRGFCPRCSGRHMNETARHLMERVFPEVRTRQWVLSFPFQLRWAPAFHHELVLSLARITHAEIVRRYRRLALAFLDARRYTLRVTCIRTRYHHDGQEALGGRQQPGSHH
jgi:hypothetical protein